MSKLRTLRRNLAARDERERKEDPEATLVPDNHLKLPIGQLVTALEVKGEFLATPVLGWIAKRIKTRIPLVMVIFWLFDEDGQPGGMLRIEFPVYPETEKDTLHYLETLGWDGRVWPAEPGWPDGDELETENIKALMAQADLNNTLAFPSKEDGSLAVKVLVERESGPFVMPPLSKATGEEKYYDRFRELCSKRWP